MTEFPFPWIFIALAGVVDMVGLFYLWRRRHSAVGANHRPARMAAQRMRILTAERRRRDRRETGQAASA